MRRWPRYGQAFATQRRGSMSERPAKEKKPNPWVFPPQFVLAFFFFFWPPPKKKKTLVHRPGIFKGGPPPKCAYPNEVRSPAALAIGPRGLSQWLTEPREVHLAQPRRSSHRYHEAYFGVWPVFFSSDRDAILFSKACKPELQ